MLFRNKYRLRNLLCCLALLLSLVSCTDNHFFDDIVGGRDLLTGLTVSPKATTFALVEDQRLVATGKYEDGGEKDLSGQVTWSSSEPSVGFVQSSGVFNAISVGETKITASFEDFTATADITVAKNAGTIYVDVNYEDGFNDGSASKPFQSIKTAVEAAIAKGAASVKVAKGNYSEETIALDSDINLNGGYNPSDWTTDEVVNPDDTTIAAVNETAILIQGGVTNLTTITGFTIVGGNDESNFTVTSAITMQSAHANISGNKIYGGKSEIISYGLLLQAANPTIENNEVISGGLPDGTGGGFDNIGILAQSSSNPKITGNTITGPTSAGDESTYRIKCESSSNARITDNTITTGALRGILAISSSPIIEANVINTDNTANIAIRGENTSFIVRENQIDGKVEIDSGSVNASLENNSVIEGDIDIANSSGISIQDHLVEDSSHHYGVTQDIILKGDFNVDNSTASFTGNVITGRINVSNNSFLAATNNFLLNAYDSGDGAGLVFITDSGIDLMDNYIENVGTEDNCFPCVIAVRGQRISQHSDFMNNIIFNHNTTTGSAEAFCFDFIEINARVEVNSNFCHTKSDGTGQVGGIRFSSLDFTYNMRVSNNFFYSGNDSITNKVRGIVKIDSGHPKIIRANYFFLDSSNEYIYRDVDQDPPGGGLPTEFYTLAELEADYLAGFREWESNTDVPDLSGVDFVDTTPSNYFDWDLHPNVGSELYSPSGQPDNGDLPDTDFDGCARDIVTPDFAIGPYNTDGSGC